MNQQKILFKKGQKKMGRHLSNDNGNVDDIFSKKIQKGLKSI